MTTQGRQVTTPLHDSFYEDRAATVSVRHAWSLNRVPVRNDPIALDDRDVRVFPGDRDVLLAPDDQDGLFFRIDPSDRSGSADPFDHHARLGHHDLIDLPGLPDLVQPALARSDCALLDRLGHRFPIHSDRHKTIGRPFRLAQSAPEAAEDWPVLLENPIPCV